MDDDTLIQVEHVSKKFCRDLKRSLWYGVRDIGGELLGRPSTGDRLRRGEFRAVDDVSFEVKRGECLGLIGPNGAGKSTMLKMLNGLIKPDAGRIRMRGRVGALIELGTGFNPILTGRENVYVNAAMHGISKHEVDRNFDEIVEFAEIGDFIDAPFRTYSSGMRVRLGFAVTTQMDPDVLLIDEVLAVGDVGFRARCYNRMFELAQEKALIFVSHSMPQISRLCTKVVLLARGKMVGSSHEPSETIGTYLRLFDTAEARIAEHGRNTIHQFALDADRSENGYVAEFGSPLEITIDATLEATGCEIEVSVVFLDNGLEIVAQMNSIHNGQRLLWRDHRMRLRVKLPQVLLNPGRYYVSIILRDRNTNKMLCWHHGTILLEVCGGFYGSAATQLLGQWMLGEANRPEAKAIA